MISFSNCFVIDLKTSAHAGPTLVATFGEKGLINLREEYILGGGLKYTCSSNAVKSKMA